MKWEYRLEKIKMVGILSKTIEQSLVINSLNLLGNDGWELITMEGTNVLLGETAEIIAILKRPKA